jgi:hypothetical protein
MRLVELGRCADIDTPGTLDRFRDLETRSELGRHNWSYWEPVAKALDTADLVALVKGVTVADEHLLGWRAGSVAAAIWVFGVLAKRDPVLAFELLDRWIPAHSTNGYVVRMVGRVPPIDWERLRLRAGGATAAELKEWDAERRRERRRQVKAGAASEREGEKRAEAERQARAEKKACAQHERLEAHRGQALERRTHLEAWLGRSAAERLHQVAVDTQHRVEWYPAEWAEVDESTMRALGEETRAALVQRLQDLKSRRGPWKDLRDRLSSKGPPPRQP